MALELGNQVKFQAVKQRSPGRSGASAQERFKASGDVLGNAKQHQSRFTMPKVSNPDKGIDRSSTMTGSRGPNPFKSKY